jgi:hypothetical protein
LLGLLFDFDLAIEPRGSCPGKGREAAEVQLPPGRSRITSATGGVVRLRRFGDIAMIGAGELPAGAVAAIEIPTDASTVPWTASITEQGVPGELELCAPATRSPDS